MASPTTKQIYANQQRSGWVSGITLLVLGLIGFALAYREYLALGKAPEHLTVEQAMPAPGSVPDNTRWVALSGLELDCTEYVQESENGTISWSVFLASDQARKRWIEISFRGDSSCRFPSEPVKGLLSVASSTQRGYLTHQNMKIPASDYPLMELMVGDGPDTGLPWIAFCLGTAGFGGIVIMLVLYRQRLSGSPSASV